MEINRTNIIELINEYWTKPDKDYGQNFLMDPIISKKIVDSIDIKDNERVLEIGPGMGSLTHFFSSIKCSYVGVDIDRRMIEFLKFHYKESNMEFIEGDIRKYNVKGFSKIISNIPYNVTTELLNYVLLEAENCEKMVLMCQSDTLKHFIDVSGKEYGPTSVLIHLLGNIKPLFNVKPGSFYPAPKCTSSVFEINLKEQKDRKIIRETYNFAKKMFLNRRKTILNNLINLIKDKDLALNILDRASILSTKRPEEISPEDFEKLYMSYKGEKNI